MVADIMEVCSVDDDVVALMMMMIMTMTTEGIFCLPDGFALHLLQNDPRANLQDLLCAKKNQSLEFRKIIKLSIVQIPLR
jgi:hypothetical protein